MKRLLLFFGALLAGGALFGFLISGVGWDEAWDSLRAFSLLHALVVFLLTLGSLFVGALRWYFILKKQRCNIPFPDVWKAYLAGFSLWFFVPMFPFVNELFRASSLKEQYEVDLPKGMASVIIDRIFEITFCGVGGGPYIFTHGRSYFLLCKDACCDRIRWRLVPFSLTSLRPFVSKKEYCPIVLEK